MKNIRWLENIAIAIVAVALGVIVYWGLGGEHPGLLLMSIWFLGSLVVSTRHDLRYNR